MIAADSLSIEWVSSKIKEFKGDPIIVEKVIRALTDQAKKLWGEIRMNNLLLLKFSKDFKLKICFSMT